MIDLLRLIDPIDLRTFRDSYWEREPLLVQRSTPSFYDGLLSLADIDEVLNASGISAATIRILEAGRETEVGSLYNQTLMAGASVLEAFYDGFRRGASFTLQGLQARWKPLADLGRSLSEDLSARIFINVYVSPPGGVALAPHYDTHDVFVLQVEGHKHWKLHARTIELPYESEHRRGPLELPDAPTREFTLQRGDLIYIPRGFAHEAVAGDATSVHLTVGLHPLSWTSFTTSMVESIVRDDPRFRRSLPPGFARDPERRAEAYALARELLGHVCARLEPERLVDEAALETERARQPELEGHFVDIVAADSLDLDSTLYRRPGVRAELRVEGERARLRFHAKTVTMPAFVEPCLRLLLEVEGIRPAELPVLDDSSKLVLVRRLLREGFLTTRAAPTIG